MGTTRVIALARIYTTPNTPHSEDSTLILAVKGHFFVSLLPPGATLADNRRAIGPRWGSGKCRWLVLVGGEEITTTPLLLLVVVGRVRLGRKAVVVVPVVTSLQLLLLLLLANP
jgi:hypothetical protein